MRSVMRFLTGFVLGGLVGISVTILLVPESGEDLRLRVRSEAGRIREEIKQAASSRRAEMEQQLESLRTPR